jgi:hypothetical protein
MPSFIRPTSAELNSDPFSLGITCKLNNLSLGERQREKCF